jgi:hypothetical protein
MVMVAVFAAAVVLAATLTVTVPLPLPDAGDTVPHVAVAGVTAATHAPLALTAMVYVPAEAAASTADLSTPNAVVSLSFLQDVTTVATRINPAARVLKIDSGQLTIDNWLTRKKLITLFMLFLFIY